MGIRLLIAGCVLLLTAPEALGRQTVSPHGDFTGHIACTECHTNEGWTPLRTPMSFDHGRDTGFDLLEAHALVSCTACHGDLEFSAERDLPESDCASCHVDVHAGSLSRVCTDCHTRTRFDDVDALGIHTETNFPLTGAHQVATCESCHVNDRGGAFALLDPECAQCHRSEYLATMSIPHVEAGFSEQCEDCHTTSIWPDAILDDHAEFSGGFDLVGAHRFAGCESCHRRPGFIPVFNAAGQNDCIACHRSDYDDEHGGSGFPVTCLDCHGQATWDDATGFDHDARFFPIYSGEHRGEWTGCVDCHTAAPDFAVFSCLTCHEHRQSSVDSEHREIAGYVYESTACLGCHPRGSGDDD